MPEIGARRFHHARLSRVLARPGRHARAPTDSTGTPGMPNSGGERTRKKKVCEIFGHDRGKRWEDGFFIITFAGRSGRLALPAGIPNARAVRPVRDTMGWLTRFLASKMEDPAKRQADFEAHMVETTAKCEEVCVRRNL